MITLRPSYPRSSLPKRRRSELALQKLNHRIGSTGHEPAKQADNHDKQTAQAGKVMGEKIKQDMSKKLLETEVLLKHDAAKAASLERHGVTR